MEPSKPTGAKGATESTKEPYPRSETEPLPAVSKAHTR